MTQGVQVPRALHVCFHVPHPLGPHVPGQDLSYYGAGPRLVPLAGRASLWPTGVQPYVPGVLTNLPGLLTNLPGLQSDVAGLLAHLAGIFAHRRWRR